jgi:hypothetical protein
MRPNIGMHLSNLLCYAAERAASPFLGGSVQFTLGGDRTLSYD